MIGAKHLYINGQGALVERLSLLVLALVMVELCQGVETLCCIGVVRAQHLFSDGQGPLVEGLGLLELALLVVEGGQVVEQEIGVGMIAPMHFFSNDERILLEWLGFSVLSTIFQVEPRVIQQSCCFIKRDVPLFDEFFTLKCMRKIALTARPRRRFIERKNLPGYLYRPFCPLTLCFLVHLILDDRLHESVDAERLGGGVAADERIFE